MIHGTDEDIEACGLSITEQADTKEIKAATILKPIIHLLIVFNMLHLLLISRIDDCVSIDKCEFQRLCIFRFTSCCEDLWMRE